MALDTGVIADDPPTGADAERVALDIVVDVVPGLCEITHGDKVVARISPRAAQRIELTTVVVSADWATDAQLAANPPHALVSADVRSGVWRRDYMSAMARPAEADDIVAGQWAAHMQLGTGWAPRELVAEQANRWVGDRASLHLARSKRIETLKIEGIAGPCLGRNASIELHAGGRRVSSINIDIEDGQPFVAHFDLAPTDNLETMTVKVKRPQPRFTPHDVRVLNLLIRKVDAR